MVVETQKGIKEEAPTNSMGFSSSIAGTGKIDTFDPLLKDKKKNRVLTRFKDLVKDDKRNRKSN